MTFSATTGKEFLEKLAMAARGMGLQVAWDFSHDFADLNALWMGHSPVLRSVLSKLTKELTDDLQTIDADAAYVKFDRHLDAHKGALGPFACIVQSKAAINLVEANDALASIGLGITPVGDGYELETLLPKASTGPAEGATIQGSWNYVEYHESEDDFHAALQGDVPAGALAAADGDDVDTMLDEVKRAFGGIFDKMHPDFLSKYQLDLLLKGDKISASFGIKYSPSDLQVAVDKALNDAVAATQKMLTDD